LAPRNVRLSIGTAAVLGLTNYLLKVPPTTAYLMSYTEKGCIANCSFCAQARDHKANRDQLSRVIWPSYTIEQVLKGFKETAPEVFKRVCLQVINYPGFFKDTVELVRLFSDKTGLPISVDIFPLSRISLKQLKDVGAERISIPLDGATPEIFDRVKGRKVNGPYSWEKHIKSLAHAVEVFGKGKVGTNLIVGLGETEKEATDFIQKLHSMSVETILFAFTPIQGTKLENKSQPSLDSYRRIQVARHLINNDIITSSDLEFDGSGKITGYGKIELDKILSNGEAFQTTGCPGCNRPYYNERPSGPFYNYPRPLINKEVRTELSKLEVNKVTET
jgi:biotin synthase